MSETRTFLLEIGTEEIPAAYLEPGVDGLSLGIKGILKSQGVVFDEVRSCFTPRRLTLFISEVAVRSEEKLGERQGPPTKVAKDDKGSWTVQAKRFAESQGVGESDLFIKENDKGSYVAVKVKTGGEETRNIFVLRLPELLVKIPFTRNMKWPQSNKTDFARPIRWICCLFGDEVVEFEYAGLKSSNLSYGHRFAHPEAITVNNPKEYVDKLRKVMVIVDPAERRKLIVAELRKSAKSLGGILVEDGDLVDEVTNLVEYPNVLCCDLGGFMDLPREVLQTALAKHQRAFVVEKGGKLVPHFLVVTNSPKLDPDLAKPWFERMAISRLEDADFFIKEDLDKGLKPLIREEARVEWIKGIGTLADKTTWLTELGLFLGKGIKGFDTKTCERAAHLAKADLLTNLVREKEFTSLQGIAGGIYSQKLGESEAICSAIADQYSDTPRSVEGAVLGIADRFLNISATFVAGKPPKGSSDPFALRRQATAIMKILTDQRIHITITSAVEKVLGLFGKEEKGQIADFLRDREVLFFKDKGFSFDWVDAVAAVAADDPYDAYLRLSAFAELDKGEEFRLVAVGQKRVANITTRNTHTSQPDTSLFQQLEEKVLWREAERIKPEVQSAVKSKNYKRALECLLSIRPAIDKFFDEVFVMVEDERIRENRLNLLSSVKEEFLKVADFSQILVEGGP
ncbi:glycine--tRNA ligase subunit beta [candidate division WOR-3 bacterium]|nr:glycine--tRNA ligase subunit beta [candidate division WOR-3 bacterium]